MGVLCGHLWRARCVARMEKAKSFVRCVIRQVQVMLSTIASSFKMFCKIKVPDKEILERLSVPIAPISVVVPQLVSWKRPGNGTLKLNVDRGSNENLGASGGGGLIRDSRCRLILVLLTTMA